MTAKGAAPSTQTQDICDGDCMHILHNTNKILGQLGKLMQALNLFLCCFQGMATAEADLIGSQCCIFSIIIKGIATQNTFYTGQMLETLCHVRNLKICVTIYIQIHITGQIVLVNICSGDDLFS